MFSLGLGWDMLGGVQGMTNQAGRIHGGQAVIAVSPKYAVKSIVHHTDRVETV